MLRGLARAPSTFILALVITIGVGAGCAGGSLSKVGGDNQLPQDLPSELVQKFEIRDAAVVEEKKAAESSARPTPSPGPVAAGPTGKKKKATPALQSPATPAPTPTAEAKAAQAAPAIKYPSRRPAKDPIWLGEKQVYEITYFGMSAGDFTLTVLPFKAVNDRKVYHVRGHAESSKVFSMFYRLDDTVQSYFDYDGFFSHRFHLLLDETKQTRDSLELYDSEKQQTFYWNRWNRKEKGYVEVKEFQPMPAFAQDSLSALYFLRVQALPTGSVITFPVVNEGKNWEAVVTVVRREAVDSPMGKVPAIVLKPETKYQGVLQKKGDSYIWLTDDDRRILLRLEAKVRIGTVTARLKAMEPGTPE
jgi:hypothetical protein